MMRINRYTPEQIEFVRCAYMTMNIRDVAKSFSIRFGINRTENHIKSTLKNHKIKCGRTGKDRLMTRHRLFTQEQKQFIRNNYPGRSRAKMTILFNVVFRANKTEGQIKAFVDRHHIKSGRSGRYKKGNIPWTAGTKGVCKPNSGSFKKGDIPPNTNPLGHERICSKDGYILIKVAEKNPYKEESTRYKHKHIHVYEQKYGPVPEGKVVCFKDGDKLNIEPENLMLISRAELFRLNKHGYKEAPAELKPSILALAKLQVKRFSVIKKTGK